MKRITTTVAISAALALSASACKGGGGGAATKYIPDAAEFVGGMSVSGMISASGQKAELEAQIEKEAEAKEFIAAAKGCNLDPWNLDKVVFGGTSKEDFAAVIVGSGFGKAENLTCISGKIKEKKGGDKEPITIEGNKATFDGGDGFGYLVDDKTLVIVSKGWDASVKALVDGTGTSAFDGSMKDAVGLTDMGKHVWFAGKIPSEMEGQLGPAKGLSMAGGSMDFTGGGLALAVAGQFADEAGAKAAADEANKGLEQVKPMAGMVGIPGTVVESVSIAAEGTKLKASAKASAEELKQIEEKMKAMGGM